MSEPSQDKASLSGDVSQKPLHVSEPGACTPLPAEPIVHTPVSQSNLSTFDLRFFGTDIVASDERCGTI